MLVVEREVVGDARDRVWTSPPPRSSALTSSPVAAFTSGGPPRKIVPVPRTITVSSLIAGTYAPPAVRRAHDERDLGDPGGRHPGLVVEDPAEVVAVREDVGLERQERAAAVDEVDARQPVLERDLLRPEVLLDRHRVVGAALDRRVVGDDDARRPLDRPDPGDDPGARGVAVVQPGRGERAQLEERRAGVEQPVDPLPDGQLAALAMAGDRPVVAAGAAFGDGGLAGAQVGDERGHRIVVGARLGARRVEAAPQDGHRGKDRSEPASARPASARRCEACPRSSCAWSSGPASSPARRSGCSRRRRHRSPVPVSSSASSVPEPATTPEPLPTPEPFPLLSIETKGGECPSGLCTRLVNVEGDGRLHEVIPKDQVIGRAPPALVDALQVEIERADYRLILSQPFTGTCPTAYDGQQLIYTFHVSTGDRTVDTCKVAIDPDRSALRRGQRGHPGRRRLTGLSERTRGRPASRRRGRSSGSDSRGRTRGSGSPGPSPRISTETSRRTRQIGSAGTGRHERRPRARPIAAATSASWTGSGDTALNGPLASGLSIAIVMIPTTSSTWTQLIHWRPEPSRPPTRRRNGRTSRSRAFAIQPDHEPVPDDRDPDAQLLCHASGRFPLVAEVGEEARRAVVSLRRRGRVEPLVAVRARDVDEDGRPALPGNRRIASTIVRVGPAGSRGSPAGDPASRVAARRGRPSR